MMLLYSFSSPHPSTHFTQHPASASSFPPQLQMQTVQYNIYNSPADKELEVHV